MEDTLNLSNQAAQPETFFAFDSPKGQSSYIKVIGVGGGGGNAVNHMYKQGIKGVDFIVCNTDMKALNASPIPNKIPLGNLGLGAGGKPEKGRKAAEMKAEEIKEALSHNTQMLFITAGMGGGTGTGAAPVIADIAKSIDLQNEENEKILVVAIVTRPFVFEGTDRCEQAEAGIAELRDKVDSIIVINNEKLRSFGNLTKSNAFAMADDILLTAARGIAEIITKDGYVNRDFQDVKTVMEHSGTALMGIGTGKGENRAHDAIEAATTSVLLDDSDINGAKNVLLYFSYSHENEMTIDEMNEVTDYVSQVTGGRAKVFWGDNFDDSLGEELKVILIATGFERTAAAAPRTFALPETEETPTRTVPVDEPTEPTLIHHQDIDVERVQPSVPTASVEQPKVNVIVLEDEEPAPAPQACAPAPTATVEDRMVQEIHLVDTLVAPEPKRAPAPAPAPTPEAMAASAFQNMTDLKLSSDRIRYIHDLLRNNPNGAEMVQGMTTAQINGGAPLYEGSHSSEREASGYTMRADGTVVKSGWLGDQPD
ncbi:MAG: cell division protein FtsZ [Bacteroidales bacterium]|nr:cell division protein FtsZ [Bacteroidales bacterium]